MLKDQEPRITLSASEIETVLAGANAQGGDLNDPSVQETLQKLMGMFETGGVIVIENAGIDGTAPKAIQYPKKKPGQL